MRDVSREMLFLQSLVERGDVGTAKLGEDLGEMLDQGCQNTASCFLQR